LQVSFCSTRDALLDEGISKWDKKDWLNFSQPDFDDFESCYCKNGRSLDGHFSETRRNVCVTKKG